MAEITAQTEGRSAKARDRRPGSGPPFHVLRPFERFAFRVMRFFNVGAGARWALVWQRIVLDPLFSMFVSRRMVVRGWEPLEGLPRGGALLVVFHHPGLFA